MNEERRKQQILHILAAGIRKVMEEAHLDYGKLQEIRLRTDQPLLILYQGEELFLPAGRAKKHMVTKEEIKETLEYSSHYSLYAYENEIRQGFLTVEGGHRVGGRKSNIRTGKGEKSAAYLVCKYPDVT